MKKTCQSCHPRASEAQTRGSDAAKILGSSPRMTGGANFKFCSQKQAGFLGLLAGVGVALSGCYNFSRLGDIGDLPPLTRTQNPVAYEGYKPVVTPQPQPLAEKMPQGNSLWQVGARAFFRDQRASRVGDIVTVIVNINDSASIKNDTSSERTETRATSMPTFYGLENKFNIKSFKPAAGVTLRSAPKHEGSGSIDRSEQVKVNVAALVTQVLPNGNLVISGRQEMRFNFEIREVLVTGVVRPEDIVSNNTIASEKIAELRIAYGGRGQLTDVQTAPYGQQILDMVLPF